MLEVDVLVKNTRTPKLNVLPKPYDFISSVEKQKVLVTHFHIKVNRDSMFDVIMSHRWRQTWFNLSWCTLVHCGRANCRGTVFEQIMRFCFTQTYWMASEDMKYNNKCIFHLNIFIVLIVIFGAQQSPFTFILWKWPAWTFC